ncbi:flagellar biosynthesis regulator FlaF [Methylobacterium nodulans]|uniref:Flagellar FlaF family protein n=1 Tax=Methylobacterium nodulans (strain LMG 21967 / CNCM I-2342 / ORS 2060) TaxID=460265 RepID=B8IM04_METNO|nr:flagellar biosynthesis regulator FlaF [Methylobacterium nodulans]ACL56348.1 flagellar FlaF family protein [Methylobacterium nodulans ORS 2060]
MSYGAHAYAKVSQVALTPREAEAAVLIKAAARLQAVQDNWAEQQAGLNEALTFNQKVWTLLSTAATEPDAPLPPELKQSMARLGAFVFTRTFDAMVEPAAEKLTALIRINREIASGLRGNP